MSVIPSFVSIVGFALVLQTIPLAVIALPPVNVILPPLSAAIAVMPVIAVVVSVGDNFIVVAELAYSVKL